MIDNYKEEALFIAKRVEDEGHSSSSMKAARTIRMLVTMLEAAQKDQARYKFIEQKHSDPDGNLCVNIAYESQVVEYEYGKKWPDLSAAIDAAMAATKGEEA